MTHPIHSADALPCNYIPDWDRNEPCETCTVCGDTRYGKSASKCEKYLAHLQKVGAAAQVGANGAADIWTWEQRVAADPKDYAERTAMLAEIADWQSRLAAGAPAETPKSDEHDYRIAQHEQVDAAILSRLIVEGVVDRNRAVALRREIRPTIATPAAAIGAGEGKDALDAARYRKIKADNDDCEAETFCLFFDSKSGGLISIESEDMDAEIDAAMRSKTSPGEAG